MRALFGGKKMKCDKCESPIESGDEREHAGQMLCEDCYMDALSPVKACDPWAVYSAKSMSSDDRSLTTLQEKILAVLRETNGIELEPLADKLGISLNELQREIATLRHMEKLRAVMDGDRKVFRLW
jgi:hypothetical protein